MKTIKYWDRHNGYLNRRRANDEIQINDRNFICNVKIFGVINVKILSFSNCVFDEPVELINLEINSELHFHDCIFKMGLVFKGNCIYTKRVELYRNSKNISLYGGNFSRVIIRGMNESNYQIKDCSFKEISFQIGSIGTDPERNHRIDRVFINTSNTDGTIILSSSLAIDKITVTGINTKTIFKSSNNEVSHLLFDDFVSKDGFRFVNTKPKLSSKNIFEIKNSDLGNTEFINIDFSKYNIHIINSFISSAKFSEVIWPKIFNIEKYKELKINGKLLFKQLAIDQINYFKESQAVNRQLKTYSKNQGNYSDELYFHSKEMYALYMTLKWNTNFQEKFILLFSYLTSNFGISILRPIAGQVIITMLIYIFVVSRNYYSNFTLFEGDINCEALKKFFTNYLVINNPFRRDYFTGGFLFWDLVLRAWTSYMIYNFIRASRRFIS